MNTIERLTANEIKKYFGAHKFRCDINAYGRLVIVDLTYQDFHPIPEVREWLNNHIPFLWNLNVERTYSKRVETKAAKGLVKNDPELQFRIEELLFSKDLS